MLPGMSNVKQVEQLLGFFDALEEERGYSVLGSFSPADAMAAEHYHGLGLHASDCVQCGHCDSRCPFRVKQQQKMGQIAAYFHKIGFR